MNPKQYKQMMDYLTRKGIKKPFTPASAIQRPKKVLEIEAFKDFNKRNSKADGGRIGFYKGELVKEGPNKGKYRVKFGNTRVTKNNPTKFKPGKFIFGSKGEIDNLINDYTDTVKKTQYVDRTPTKTITKEKNLKKIFDKIFEEKDFSGIKSEFPGVAKEEGDINKYDPSRKGKTGGKIPNQLYTRNVGPAVRGDVDALNDLARITGRTVNELKDAFSKINLKTVRSEAAARTSAKLDPVNKKLVDLIKNNVVDKETIKKTLNISEDKFQKSIADVFKQSYGIRSQINKGKTLTSYVGNTAEEITNLLQKLKQVDGVDQVVQRRNITQILDDLFGKEGTMPNPNSYNIMMKRVDEFYKLRALLPEGIKLHLDHPLPEVLIQQLEKSAPTALRANVQPITQALNLGLKSKIDTAYANAYDLASKGNLKAKKIMGAIDEVAEKIDLPLGKVTNKYVDLGKNPFLGGDLKRTIIDNLKAQNLIVSKFEALDPKLKQRAGLDRLKNINIPQINIKQVERAFGISGEEGFMSKEFIKDTGKFLGRAAQGAFLTPTGIAATTLGLGGLDLTTPAGRLSLGAEAAFAPELVKASIGATRGMKNRALQKGIQRFLNLGLKTPTALRLARIASPIGIASLGAEGAYQLGKFTKKRIGELRAMSPEQRQELRRKGDEFAFSEFAAAGGGIAKEAGDPSGAMLESMNPDSQGLPGLLKRGRKG